MAVHRWRDIRAKKMTPEQLARLDERVQADLRRIELEGPPAADENGDPPDMSLDEPGDP